MNEKKIINLNIKPAADNKIKTEKEKNKFAKFQTEPVSKMLFANLINKKNKFSFKDLFR